MHSTGELCLDESTSHISRAADVIAGILMGLFCWVFWIFAGDASEAWVNSGTIWGECRTADNVHYD